MFKKAPKKLKALGRGVTILYRGDGKGKTTAAVGVATRAVGYGWPVLFLQFYKSDTWPSGERRALERLGVDVRVMGLGFVGIIGDKRKRIEHQQAAKKALDLAKKLIRSKKYKLVVLDEAISTLEQKLLKPSDIVSLLKDRTKKAPNVHVVMTGHEKFSKIEKLCDLVTEMKLVKHPYYRGFVAIRGVDF